MSDHVLLKLSKSIAAYFLHDILRTTQAFKNPFIVCRKVKSVIAKHYFPYPGIYSVVPYQKLYPVCSFNVQSAQI